ncbi:hypothetical protein BAUCODRAFT_66267 [Baudoinia panamericana UAMH 10762]|uniref:Uncharacterized protein n=1 Tax=Baudoinia panamericana (strain UAMH 10762) TaxID=717646 RepID=M2LUL2_BAUPA|nr:uncharacterized protein BAUCODRAFT_66267 [Baudoinia panamericana UAMH 10762]EMC98282.1 hypothetical protein BAUCODRAFT_66267 [Baudoinia panamericana UAMH 10762]
MSSLEPPVPANAADAFTPYGTNDEAAASRFALSSKTWQRWRRATGLFLLAMTVFLWTASNFLASTIFADDTYSKPYLMTYINTSFFIVPLLPILLRRAYHNRREVKQWLADWRNNARINNNPITSLYAGSSRSARRRQSANASEEHLLGRSSEADESQDNAKSTSVPTKVSEPEGPMDLAEIARLAFEFCLLWFVANYFTAACLQYTTVASSTILTSTSSIFTLLFGAVFKVERFTLRKLFAVIASLAGIMLISGADFSGGTTDDEHRGDFPEKTLGEIALGDSLALLSAVMYGLYASFMKKRVGDESRVSLPIFFGFVGLINVVLLWPGFFILHFAGWETFESPPTKRVVMIIVVNSLASLIADLAWAYAILLTSPIVVTVGLSMTIPLSLIGQMVLNNQTAGVVYWLGAAVVVLSFVFVNQEEKQAGSEDKVDGEDNVFRDDPERIVAAPSAT